MSKLRKVTVFLVQSIVAGLAAAFVIVYLNPDLLPGRGQQVDVGSASREEGSYATAVSATAPAVVNIYTARVVLQRSFPPPQFDFLFRNQSPSYRQRIQRSLGSGVIVDRDGYIVTNYHVIRGAQEIRVQLADGRVGEASVVGTDPDTDLAVLEIDLPDLPVMSLGRSDSLRIGDVVLAIGNPFGLSQTVTQGIVSATGRGQLGVTTFENFIQTDAAINLGNSGGALVNTSGELVGINTAVVAEQDVGIGFAIPVNLVRGVVGQLIAQGHVVRGWLGVTLQDLTAPRARVLGIPGVRGGELVDVVPDSPAHRAGLRPGDVITHVNGQPIRISQDALNVVAGLAPGSTVQITAIRGGEPIEIEAEVIARPTAGG